MYTYGNGGFLFFGFGNIAWNLRISIGIRDLGIRDCSIELMREGMRGFDEQL